MVKFNQSAYNFIEDFQKKYKGKITEIEFSVYRSGGKGVTLDRKIFNLPVKSNLIEILEFIMPNLNNGYELAIHSNVYKNKNQYFIPMIDFTTGNVKLINKALKEIKDYAGSKAYLYNTGRSFHAYLLKVINEEEWHKFLGKLLLINSRGKPHEIIDSRWVGHSLENGFSALRLSYNSKWYFKKPTFVKAI